MRTFSKQAKEGFKPWRQKGKKMNYNALSDQNKASNIYAQVSKHFVIIKHTYKDKTKCMLNEKAIVHAQRGNVIFIQQGALESSSWYKMSKRVHLMFTKFGNHTPKLC